MEKAFKEKQAQLLRPKHCEHYQLANTRVHSSASQAKLIPALGLWVNFPIKISAIHLSLVGKSGGVTFPGSEEMLDESSVGEREAFTTFVCCMLFKAWYN